MTKLNALFIAMSLALASVVEASAEPHTVDASDKIALTEFGQAIDRLEAEVTRFCSNKTDEAPLAEWTNVATRWFNVQAMQLPAAQFMQTEFEYIFWPDPKDRLRKQVLAATAQSPSETDWSTLTASVKSFSAIEFLLTQDDARDYCDWYTAIIKNRAKTAQQLIDLGKYYDFSSAEQLTALHGTALTLHMILKEVLSRPGKTMWVLAPGWRSESGDDIGNALVEQTVALLSSLDGTHSNVQSWSTSFSELDKLSVNATRQDIETLNALSESLAVFVETTLAPAMNLYIGFNNFDGD
jgi:predicted lipoprotein